MFQNFSRWFVKQFSILRRHYWFHKFIYMSTRALSWLPICKQFSHSNLWFQIPKPDLRARRPLIFWRRRCSRRAFARDSWFPSEFSSLIIEFMSTILHTQFLCSKLAYTLRETPNVYVYFERARESHNKSRLLPPSSYHSSLQQQPTISHESGMSTALCLMSVCV
jgi:hypothetical protein